ncbi:carbohydrate kinase family protein [Archangium sp.]|uniref:carbohydrate kinase family protein n=1 Tax=Archangium sp. TaxID=1872627 RepID=UPI002D27FBF1|nr:carbohydrate kinase family protein [Archangium sp.]HYO54881.1 carbohydrate kinase family protein [Archangium sp.]
MAKTSGDIDAVVAGCIGVDTNVYLYGADIDFNVEANFSQNIDCVGQAGGYSSLGFAGLGRRTAFIGSVGRDWHGEHIRHELTRAGVEALMFDDPPGTHRSVNFMYRDGRRKNFYDGKGHMDLRPDLDACRAVLSRSRVMHVHLENWCRELLPLARQLGVVVSCDLQDVTSLDDPYRRDFIEQADILFFSTVNFPDPREAIARLRQGHPERLVIGGMGARGCVLGGKEGVRFFPPVELDTPVVDTNGAGDALAVGFLTGHVLEGRPPEDAILRGQIAARYVCSQRAGQKQLITASRLDELFHR